MVNEIQTVSSEFLKMWQWGALLCALSLYLLYFLSLSPCWFPSTPCTPSPFPLCLSLSTCRPLRGGQTWWWSMPKPSCVSTRPTWTQLLRFSRLTAGTVSPSSSCLTTSWEWTVSEELLKLIFNSQDRCWSSWMCLEIVLVCSGAGWRVKWSGTGEVGLMKGMEWEVRLSTSPG